MFSFASFLLFASLSTQPTGPLTRAERTNYAETSHYEDVLSFLDGLQQEGDPISVQMIGKSAEGRPIPLVIASFPPVTTPAQARRLGRPIVYVEANIHAGEVEGKEAILMILRRLSREGSKGLLGKIVLLTTPIYNIDGNEKFGPASINRSEQDGPALVGERANGQGLDLNRDAIKAESPEARAAIEQIYNAWDPDLMMDLHTTDGTRHGWELTYSPPEHPNTDLGILHFSRDEMLPFIRKDFAAKYGSQLFDYGNLEGSGPKHGWYTFGFEGRYWTDYVGLRNRIGILSEATSFIPFKARVEATDRFVTEVLDYTATHAKKVMQLTRDADERMVEWGTNPDKAPALGVRFAFASRGTDTVLIEHRSPGSPPPPPTSRPAAIDTLKLPVFDRFVPTKTAKFPASYLIPAGQTRLVDLLRLHGIAVERLKDDWNVTADRFSIQKADIAARPFQGHRLIVLDGDFASGPFTAEHGSYLVRTAQPLGVLAFHILEPEGTDGAAAWGFLGESFKAGQNFPVAKVFTPVRVATERLTDRSQ